MEEFTASTPERPEAAVVPPPRRLPFSQLTIWGLVISCASLFVFGFIGALGAAISGQGFRAAAQGRARGKGLALAGIIIGAAGFVYWAIVFLASRPG